MSCRPDLDLGMSKNFSFCHVCKKKAGTVPSEKLVQDEGALTQPICVHSSEIFRLIEMMVINSDL